MGRSPLAWMQSLRSRQIAAAVLVTILTFVVIGVVLLAATPVGCDPANARGIKTISSRCSKQLAALPSPSATPFQLPSPTGARAGPTPSPSPSPTPVFSPSPPPTGAVPPDTGPATLSYPPFYPPSSSPSGGIVPALGLNCRLPV